MSVLGRTKGIVYPATRLAFLASGDWMTDTHIFTTSCTAKICRYRSPRPDPL